MIVNELEEEKKESKTPQTRLDSAWLQHYEIPWAKTQWKEWVQEKLT